MGLRRRHRLGLAALAASVLLTGCIRADADLAVEGRDDTISGTITLVAPITEDTEQAREVAASAALAIEAQALPTLRSLESVSAAPIEQDGYYGTQLTLTGTSIDDLFLGSNPQLPVITRDGNVYNVSAVIDPLSVPEVAAGTVEGERPAGAADSMLTISLTFPGEVTSVAGSEDLATVEDNTVTWQTPWDTTLTMEATAQASASSFPAWIWQALLWGVLALLALAAIGLLVVFIRSRND